MKYCDNTLLTEAFQYNGSFDDVDVPEWIDSAFRDGHLQIWDGQLVIVQDPDCTMSNMQYEDEQYIIRYGITGEKVHVGDYIVKFDFWGGGRMSAFRKEKFDKKFIAIEE